MKLLIVSFILNESLSCGPLFEQQAIRRLAYEELNMFRIKTIEVFLSCFK